MNLIHLILFSGLIFWIFSVIFGAKKDFVEKTHPWFKFFFFLRKIPGLLFFLGLTLILSGLYLTYLQGDSGKVGLDIIGPYFFGGVVCSMFGGLSLSAQFFIKIDKPFFRDSSTRLVR